MRQPYCFYHYFKTSKKNRTIKYKKIVFEVKKPTYTDYLTGIYGKSLLDADCFVVGDYFLNVFGEEAVWKRLCEFCLVFKKDNIPHTKEDMEQCIALAISKIKQYYKVNDYDDEGVAFI